ncbi:MAG: DUF4082 domain-containing protein [Chitinispirillaceae bacterium]|nr:DUF4082 domain-containing protein [Chitinispirillaceae bacterium]
MQFSRFYLVALMAVSIFAVVVFGENTGYTTIYSGASSNTNRRAVKDTMPEDGQITSMSMYHNAGTSGQMQMGIYADNNGVPGSLLASTEKTNIATTAGWQTINLTSPISVTSGTYIWLAWMYQTGSGARYLSSGGNGYRTVTGSTWSTSSTNMPSSFGTTSWTSGVNFSVYATYTPQGGTTYSLTVNVTGAGTVSKNPDKSSYDPGELVTLTASPASCFTGWSGDASGSTNPLTVTMNGNKTIGATFPDVCAPPDIWTRDPGVVSLVEEGDLIGLGTDMPAAKLDIAYNLPSGFGLKVANSASYAAGISVQSQYGPGLDVTSNYNTAIRAFANPGVLAIEAYGDVQVNGQVECNVVKIKDWTIEAPDYVFDKNYKLPALKELEEIIMAQKHLPEVPSAAEMKKNGVDLSELNMTLLKKVEELTLYVIEQNKKIESLEEKVSGK